MLLFVGWLVEVRVNILWQNSVLESVGAEVVPRQTIQLHFVGLCLQPVVEGSMLSPLLAFNPVLDFFKAHAARHFFALDAVHHSLIKGVAGMGLHVDASKWFHCIY